MPCGADCGKYRGIGMGSLAFEQLQNGISCMSTQAREVQGLTFELGIGLRIGSLDWNAICYQMSSGEPYIVRNLSYRVARHLKRL